MQTIGILLPRSTYYTGLSFDIFEGVRASLAKLGREDIRVVTENIGFGTDKQQCYKGAEQLIMHENASVVLAYVGHRMAQVLRPLFQASNRLLIVLDAGANAPHEWPETPNIFYHSLHNALGSWLTAKRAARDGYSQGGMITGYYDGGYLQTWGLCGGFEESGSTINFNHATGYNKEDFSMLPLKGYVEDNPNGALLSIFSGDYVQWYFQGLKEVFGDENLPIYLPPFGCEESMLKEAVYPGDGARGIAAWSKTLENEANKTFIHEIEERGREANLFSLIGWEGAIIGLFASECMKENKNNIALVAEQLNAFSFESPRGHIRFHAPTRHSIGPMYEVKIENDGNDRCVLRVESKIEETVADLEAFVAKPMENVVSGWYNSYTCI